MTTSSLASKRPVRATRTLSRAMCSADDAIDDNIPVRSRNRKRELVKSEDKKFLCPFPGCNKKYGRAEHLYRHELNHQPKDIYICEKPGCDRRFVRADLLARHHERHEKDESGQVRSTKSRYNLAVTLNHLSPDPMVLDGMCSDIATRRDSTMEESLPSLGQTPDTLATSFAGANVDEEAMSECASSIGEWAQPHAPGLATLVRAMHDLEQGHANFPVTNFPVHSYVSQDAMAAQGSSIPLPGAYRQPAPIMTRQPGLTMHRSAMSDMGPCSIVYAAANDWCLRSQSPVDENGSNIHPISRNLSSFERPDAPLMGFASVSPATFQSPEVSTDFNNSLVQCPTATSAEAWSNAMEDWTIPFVNPLGSPIASNDVLQWLFEHSSQLQQPHSLTDLNMFQTFAHFNDTTSIAYPFPAPTVEQPRAFEDTFSADRRRRLIRLVVEDFKDCSSRLAAEARANILKGDMDSYPHVLSLPMLETYLRGFWHSVHHQIPIMHRPTFSPESCPDALFIAVLALGAANIDTSHSHDLRRKASELASFLVWHARMALYKEPEFGPPAQLWVIQALLLLELYEKMYGWQSLHDRGHIHHSALVTLMRRGSSMIGRYSPDYSNDGTRTPPGPCGSINTGGYNTNSREWNHFISVESNIRTALAAYVMDTTHAHMFGHSAAMVAHEMTLQLPCDETMWAARSWTQFQAAKAELQGQATPLNVPFLEALRNTLNNRPVKTNVFGRVSIMAGLLSISWQLKAQDVRADIVGVGSRNDWNQQLMNAFDFWERDFRSNLYHHADLHARTSTNPNLGLLRPNFRGSLERDNIFEARTILHRLGHISINVDLHDCMVVAGAKLILGSEVAGVQRAKAAQRVHKWAHSPKGQRAALHAFHFLASVLQPLDVECPEGFVYSIGDDVLFNRPWVMFMAAIVLWAYGYAMDGPLVYPPQLEGLDNLQLASIMSEDMHGYFRRVRGALAKPEDWSIVGGGRNEVMGLLIVMQSNLRQGCWELFVDASEMLGRCVKMLCSGKGMLEHH